MSYLHRLLIRKLMILGDLLIALRPADGFVARGMRTGQKRQVPGVCPSPQASWGLFCRKIWPPAGQKRAFLGNFVPEPVKAASNLAV
jgi:hypothetical protein